jgi:hypothetical protein
MARKVDLLHVFCDESGFTGNKLLDADQEVFSYAAVAMEPTEAGELVARLRRDFRMQAPELKGSKLIARPQGRKVVTQALKECAGRYRVVAHLKPYALACKFFEYIFEPAVSDFNSFLYGVDFHRFIAAVLFAGFRAEDKSGEAALEDFMTFAHKGDLAALERIFPTGITANSRYDFLAAVGTFALLHQDEIKNEVMSFREPSVPNWILDLTTTSLFGLLADWGQKARQLEVTCDESRPVKGDMLVFDCMVDRKDSVYVRFQNKKRPLTFNLKSPLQMADSKTIPGLQIADVVASATAYTWRAAYRRNLTDECRQWAEMLKGHFSDDNIWPDLSYADLATPKCFANMMILHELVDRSVKKEDLYEGLPAIFRAALQFHPQFVKENKLRRTIKRRRRVA